MGKKKIDEHLDAALFMSTFTISMLSAWEQNLQHRESDVLMRPDRSQTSGMLFRIEKYKDDSGTCKGNAHFDYTPYFCRKYYILHCFFSS